MKPQFTTTRRSLNTGYVGQWSNWSGTPRQMSRLSRVTQADPESRWWWRYGFAFAVGFICALAVVTR